jgi:hypothetical protein
VHAEVITTVINSASRSKTVKESPSTRLFSKVLLDEPPSSNSSQRSVDSTSEVQLNLDEGAIGVVMTKLKAPGASATALALTGRETGAVERLCDRCGRRAADRRVAPCCASADLRPFAEAHERHCGPLRNRHEHRHERHHHACRHRAKGGGRGTTRIAGSRSRAATALRAMRHPACFPRPTRRVGRRQACGVPLHIA